MAGHILELRGCTSEPLGNYLKALGAFRLIAEQADARARAWWQNGALHVMSRFATNDDLLSWFRDEYSPTALLAPWSINSGLWPPKSLPPPRGDKRATPNSALRRLAESHDSRFRQFGNALATFLGSFDAGASLPQCESALSAPLRRLLARLESAPKKAQTRSGLLRELRNKAQDREGVAWLDSVGTVRSGRDASAVLFPLLADGASEGVNSFVGNFYRRLCDHLPVEQAATDFWRSAAGQVSLARLRNSLFGTAFVAVREPDAAGGPYWPGLVEAPNIGQDFVASPKKRGQPWDFILAMECAPLWSSAATRRGERLPRSRVSFPFYCESSLGGSSTLAHTEVPGTESTTNGEIWCPLWGTPASIAEVRALFAQGRLIAFERTATRASHFACAVASLGADRGIVAFQRVALLERSGSGDHTTSLAIHLGCLASGRLRDIELLGEFQAFDDSVASDLHVHANQPGRLLLARQRFEESLLDAAGQGLAADAQRRAGIFLAVLVAAGSLERELGLTSGDVKFKAKRQLSKRQIPPVAPLTRRWLEASAADTAVYRLARSVTGIAAWGEQSREGRRDPAVQCVRANLLPVVRRSRRWEWYDPKRHKGIRDASVWSRGAALGANLATVLRRRLIDGERDAERGVGRGLPLWSSDGAGFQDLLAFWRGDVDEQALADVIFALSLVDAGKWDSAAVNRRQQSREPTPDLQTGLVWFDAKERAKTRLNPVEWHGQRLLSQDDLRAAFELPRVYHLLKLCFVGGRLPRRPVDGKTAQRTGKEPYPPACLDVLTLLNSGRLPETAQLAARRLSAKGYPALLREVDILVLDMDLDSCRRLAGMLLIPVRQPGVCAALAIKPEAPI